MAVYEPFIIDLPTVPTTLQADCVRPGLVPLVSAPGGRRPAGDCGYWSRHVPVHGGVGSAPPTG